MELKNYWFLLPPAIFSFLLLISSSFIPDYGFFNDEFYYIACANRLDWGYVDHPPFSIGVLYLINMIFGDSLIAVRAVPAFCSSIVVFLSGLIVRELGGSRSLQIISAFSVSFLPVPLIIFSLYSMNSFEILFMSIVFLLILKMVKENDTKYWILIGIIMGLGFMNKHTVILYLVSLLIGFIMSRNTKLILSRNFLYAIILAFVIFLPNLIWQISNGFSSLEFYNNATKFKNINSNIVDVLLFQILSANPILSVIWIAGLFSLFLKRDLSGFRLFGWAYIFLIAIMIISGSSRPDRIVSIYYILIPIGWIAIDIIRKKWLNFLIKYSTFILSLVVGLILVPFSLPLLPPETAEKYFEKTSLNIPIEAGLESSLPMFYVYRMDWEKPAEALSKVLKALHEDEQSKTLIVAGNYGFASSIEFYSDKFDLPKVICNHNSFWHWSKDILTSDITTLISFGITKESLENSFDSVISTGKIVESKYWYDHFKRPIYICRNPKDDLQKLWIKARYYK
jgi:hypothetical protein